MSCTDRSSEGYKRDERSGTQYHFPHSPWPPQRQPILQWEPWELRSLSRLERERCPRLQAAALCILGHFTHTKALCRSCCLWIIVWLTPKLQMRLTGPRWKPGGPCGGHRVDFMPLLPSLATPLPDLGSSARPASGSLSLPDPPLSLHATWLCPASPCPF